jgi:hypothetical protein
MDFYLDGYILYKKSFNETLLRFLNEANKKSTKGSV